MAYIHTRQGLNIPMSGIPTGDIQVLPAAKVVALDLTAFSDVPFRLLVKVGDTVKIGQPLVEDKQCAGRFFVSPGGGVVKEIQRGDKRRLLNVVIELAEKEEQASLPTKAIEQYSPEELVEVLMQGGAFAHIRQRPFNCLANPKRTPKAIFVKAIESAPLMPHPEEQVKGFEAEFQAGLTALAKLSSGKVHLVHQEESSFAPFVEAKGVTLHRAKGPHPISNVSLHIHCIEPIESVDDCIWTLSVLDVLVVGSLLLKGVYPISRIVSVGGPGILEGKPGFFKTRMGAPVATLFSERLKEGVRLVSGDPLMGSKVDMSGFLGFSHVVVCAILESEKREFLHFFRLGSHKFTASGAYLSGYLKNRQYDFTTSAHGEHRGFIDGSIYQDVMPMRIPAVQLVKAVMAEDFELAEELGLLEVDAEDFALPTFICPSKSEMSDIIEKGLKAYAKEVMS
ncbi:MAG: nqrA [Chlamydiales bacterium]|jgi:Na+-transporting NADH:ubiquinone oxidoreductase subunit A|nr:nqrA [Chlamydiales bacterium]